MFFQLNSVKWNDTGMWTPREIVKLIISRLGRAVRNFRIRFIFMDEETEAQNGCDLHKVTKPH